MGFGFPSVILNELSVWVSDSAWGEIKKNTHNEWNQLADEFELIEYSHIISSYPPGTGQFILLRFEGIKNPYFLAPVYAEIPGVISAEPHRYDGDNSNLFPWIIDEKPTFLAYAAWGDCPSGCIHKSFHYFEQTDYGLFYIGSWEGNNYVNAPSWWKRASLSLCRYGGRGSLCPPQ
jgi:hypothetical protein